MFRGGGQGPGGLFRAVHRNFSVEGGRYYISLCEWVDDKVQGLLLASDPLYQCFGSKCIEFGSGSRILAQFGTGSRVMV